MADTGDNQHRPFVIVDKAEACVFVFASSGGLLGASPVLLGSACGDDSVLGIGQRAIQNIRPEESTTPTGRFVAEPGRNAGGEDIVWVDYDAAVSMHRVRPINPPERRLERLATISSSDNRIAYGCINLPAAFYNNVVSPLFAGTSGIVYLLPESKPLKAVFGAAQTGKSPPLRTGPLVAVPNSRD